MIFVLTIINKCKQERKSLVITHYSLPLLGIQTPQDHIRYTFLYRRPSTYSQKKLSVKGSSFLTNYL